MHQALPHGLQLSQWCLKHCGQHPPEWFSFLGVLPLCKSQLQHRATNASVSVWCTMFQTVDSQEYIYMLWSLSLENIKGQGGLFCPKPTEPVGSG